MNFDIPNALQFDIAQGGLARAVISTPLAVAEIYLQGAHIAHWTPRGQDPVLFMSSKSFLEPGKPIRGGVPIIFPWFGARSDGKPGPAHGFARTSLWSVESTQLLDSGAVEIVFAVPEYSVRFTATIGSELEMVLDVSNNTGEPLKYEEALHTYFTVSNIRNVQVEGLEGTTYIDKTDGFTRKVQPEAPISIARETDQVHLNTRSTCIISDPDLHRRIEIRKTGSNSTVVWNPWIAKTAGMADMEPDGWQRMICVETANAADNAITLAPGESHRLTATIKL